LAARAIHLRLADVAEMVRDGDVEEELRVQVSSGSHHMQLGRAEGDAVDEA
jgi:hypothetical protein